MKTKIVSAFQKDGSIIKIICRQDEHNNLWVIRCPQNDANGVEWGCFVPSNGNEREARENSLRYVIGEGKYFVVGENPWTSLAARLAAMQERVLIDNDYAQSVSIAIKSIH